MHSKGYVEILCQRPDGKFYVYTALQLIAKPNGLHYRRGPDWEFSIAFELKECNVIMKIGLDALMWIMTTYEKKIRKPKKQKHPSKNPLLNESHNEYNLGFTIEDSSNNFYSSSHPLMEEFMNTFHPKGFRFQKT